MICRAVGLLRAQVQRRPMMRRRTGSIRRQQVPMGGALSLDALNLKRIVASSEEHCLEPVTQDNSVLAPPSARKKWRSHF